MNIKLSTVLQIILFLAILVIGILNLVNPCKEQPDLKAIKKAFIENQKSIDSLNQEIKGIRGLVANSLNHIDSLNRSNENTIKKFGKEISKMDELFKNNSDSTIVNSVIRYWTERIYELPDFFQSINQGQ